MSEQVMIIGVDPPCPRCDLTRQRVERVVREMHSPVTVRHLVYDDPDARSFALSIGKETGTAKQVAEKAGIEMDWDRVHSIIEKPPSRPHDFEEIDGPARRWSPQLDEALRPCQEKAESVGIIMTPILVVDGEVKHHGSVPTLEQLRVWLA